MTNDYKQRILSLVTDDDGNYYYNGPLDGVWGPASQTAADRFLKDFSGEEKSQSQTGSGSFWDEIEFFGPTVFITKNKR